MQRITLSDMDRLVSEVLVHCVSQHKTAATILTLQGNLGAGKTTFVQALARAVGVSSAVQSPTYVLMKSYPIAFHQFRTLVHIDAYRLDTPEEFSALNPQSFLSDPSVLVCIEWPERLVGVLPHPDVEIQLAHIQGEETVRMIEIQKAS